MSSDLSPFRIEILDANNNPVSGGSIATVMSITDTRSLDNIGRLSFTMPAGDRKAQYIQTGSKFDVFADGKYLGRYLFKSKTITDDNGVGILVVDCYDALKTLTERTVGFNRSYNFESVSVIIGELLDIVGFSSNVTETGTSLISYQGESVLRAIDELRDRRGVHYRLDFDENTAVPILEFGPFGELSDIVLEDAKGQVQYSAQLNDKIAYIVNAEIVEESDDIFNRIIPLGAGQGVSQLTIEQATLGTYPKLTGTNPDGSNYYYIEDIDSILAYGVKERILSFPNINPLTNSEINVINAANALKITAEAYLQKHLVPRKEYALEIVNLPHGLKVGNKVKVRYLAERNGVPYININNEEFYILDITVNRSVDGSRSYTINVANVDQRRTSDTDVIIDVVRDINSINVHIPATLAYSPVGPYVKRIRGDATPANRINAVYSIRIKEEVLYLNRALLRFETSPLKSSTTGAASGGGGTSAAGGDHTHGMFLGGGTTVGTGTRINYSPLEPVTFAFELMSGSPPSILTTFQGSGDHTHDVPAHTHPMVYDVFENNVFPQNLGIIINGVDVTTELGGPFAPSNSGVSHEIDITDILTNTIGGFRQTHTIEFYSTTSSSGEIEFECDLLTTIQPIRVQ